MRVNEWDKLRGLVLEEQAHQSTHRNQPQTNANPLVFIFFSINTYASKASHFCP